MTISRLRDRWHYYLVLAVDISIMVLTVGPHWSQWHSVGASGDPGFESEGDESGLLYHRSQIFVPVTF